MNMAVRIHDHGDREQMRWEEAPIAAPDAGWVQLRHTAIGVNFSDVNVRRGGFYPGHRPGFPLTLGNEAAGVVELVGTGVTDVAVTDRVAYAGLLGQFFEDTGAYTQRRNVPAARLVAIPDAVTDQQAAAMLMKGCTASLIINRLGRPQKGDVVLIHTVASGVGSILCQWAHHLGATVIGTAGSTAKAGIGRANGCAHVILYRETGFVAAVRALAPQGIDLVLDGVGKDTFLDSLDLLRPFGRAVNYGNASGNVPPFDIMKLAVKSITVARAGVTGHIADTTAFRQVAGELFALVAAGAIHPAIGQTYELRDASEAHRDLEEARHSGSLLLLP
ncbi:quinone oxidoreductase [Sphingomonas sp. 2R-10]|uniref:quinone oxidoreductase family protein n=1 Tax=Sphingomonas sp. 2R-10 TaxID=3045148 RepID=UPI0013DDF975|nr:quinone oxidoreductase [Sphingomonas sp. 2R-10]MDJ0278052.1 quinone oxidoreductase [Sphingomonas sp. 2R-10]